MKRVSSFVLGTLVLALGMALPGAPAVAREGLFRRSAVIPASAATGGKGTGRMTTAGKLLRSQGYLVKDQAAYLKAKGAAAARAGRGHTASAGPQIAPTPTPQLLQSWDGATDGRVTPSDSTGAVGPTRYIELINDKFVISNRKKAALAAGELSTLAGALPPSQPTDMSDPQVMWDSGTNRFYYVIVSAAFLNGHGPDNYTFFGWSRTSSPNDGSSASWCKYSFNDGQNLFDYPKLGDTSNFLLIGANLFQGTTPDYVSSGVTWIGKPGPGTSCPKAASIRHGDRALLIDANPNPGPDDYVWTPVPGNQVDPSGIGYVVGTDYVGNPGGPGSARVYEWSVKRNKAGNAVLPALPSLVAVTPYSTPPAAPQPPTPNFTPASLDTLDARLTNAISAADPFHGGRVGIWTQQTVAGGAGSAINWYEIDPLSRSVLNQGAETNPSLYVFNGAISPDRLVGGKFKAYGDSAVIGFNTSSSADYPAIQIASITPLGSSDFRLIQQVDQSENDFSCSNGAQPGVCRWGDYSGASPDPAASPFANRGQVWFTNAYIKNPPDPNGDPGWATFNWEAVPTVTAKMTQPSKRYQTARSFNVAWADVAGSKSFDVRYRVAPWNGGFGPFNVLRTDTTDVRALFFGRPGNTYCFSVQPRDADGGWGFSRERCTAVPLDDRSLAASGPWSRQNGRGFFLGTFSQSSTVGAVLFRGTIRARNIAVLVETCPTCGSIQIFWGSTLVRTYSLHSSSVRKMVFLRAVAFRPVRAGTLSIRVSSFGKPVIIDGLAISRV
jgi:hypothetical protein